MADSRNGSGGGEKSFEFSDPLFIMGTFVVLYFSCWAAWTFAHEQISSVYVYVRYVQLWLFSAIGTLIDVPVFSHAKNWVNEICGPVGLIGTCQRDFSTITWDQISNSTILINGVFLILIILYCIKLFKQVNKTHPQINYSKTHNIESFVKENIHLYPHLLMFSELDLIDQPIDDPVFGMSETSRQFAFKNRLISGWKLLADGSYLPTLDRDAAFEVFRQQLGKHWTKSTDLSPGETLLVAIAMPRVAATDPALSDDEFKKAMNDSLQMIDFCWKQFKPPTKKTGSKKEKIPNDYSWLTPEIDLTEPRKIILKYINYSNVVNLLNAHAFNKTVLFGLYNQARRLGVLQPAEMRWLRFYDRSLWYALQTIGKQCGFAEAGGVLSHYLYEGKVRTALVEPQLDKAINGLELAMNSYKFLEADKLRYEKQANKEGK